MLQLLGLGVILLASDLKEGTDIMRLKYEELGNAIAAAQFMARRGTTGTVRVVEVYEDQDIGDMYLVDPQGWEDLRAEVEDPVADLFVHYRCPIIWNKKGAA